MISPRTSTMMRSAWANTASMSCSVNSTPSPRSRAMRVHQLHQLRALLGRHAGGRLVHQQQLGRAGERDGQLHALDVAVGQLARRTVGVGGHADAVEQRKRLVAVEAARIGPPRPRAAVPADQRHLHVLDHRHGHEGLRHLEGAPDAQAPDAARRQAGDVLAGQHHAAAVGRELAAHHVEERRLAGAVGADDGEQLAGLDRERDVARGHHAAERFVQPLDASRLMPAPLRGSEAWRRPSRAACAGAARRRRCRAARPARWR